MRHITLNDLAKQLNLSPSTVSRALRNHPDISERTKERVREMAAATNYQPNLIAQSLQNRRSNNIGVIVPEIRNTFFSTVISGIEEVMYKAGYIIMVCQSNESYTREIMNIQALAANRVAGILISTSDETTNLDHLQTVLNQGIRLVMFDRIIEELPVDKVVVDDFEGAYAAVTHLIERGYRRIAHLTGSKNLSISRKRQQGYKAALRDHGLPFQPDYLINCGYHEEDGRAGAEMLCNLPERPDALFAINDPVAMGASIYFQDHHLEIPKDIAIVGFSNNPNTTLVKPRITTINQPAFEMGKSAASLMLKRLDTKNSDRRNQTVVLKTHLIVRESS